MSLNIPSTSQPRPAPTPTNPLNDVNRSTFHNPFSTDRRDDVWPRQPAPIFFSGPKTHEEGENVQPSLFAKIKTWIYLLLG